MHGDYLSYIVGELFIRSNSVITELELVFKIKILSNLRCILFFFILDTLNKLSVQYSLASKYCFWNVFWRELLEEISVCLSYKLRSPRKTVTCNLVVVLMVHSNYKIFVLCFMWLWKERTLQKEIHKKQTGPKIGRIK